jgi:RNA polymerase sigma-70 factor, ECF subfamily
MSETDHLLRKAVEGDRSARTRLLTQHVDRLTRMVRARMDPRLHRRFGASDIVQEALVEADRRLADYATGRPMSFYVWLRTLTLQKLCDAVKFHRRRRRDADQEIPLESHSPATSRALAVELAGTLTSPGQAAERAELVSIIRKGLRGLTAEHREVLLLRHWEGLKNNEIAEALGISRSAASKRYITALQRLQTWLAETPGLAFKEPSPRSDLDEPI